MNSWFNISTKAAEHNFVQPLDMRGAKEVCLLLIFEENKNGVSNAVLFKTNGNHVTCSPFYISYSPSTYLSSKFLYLFRLEEWLYGGVGVAIKTHTKKKQMSIMQCGGGADKILQNIEDKIRHSRMFSFIIQKKTSAH